MKKIWKFAIAASALAGGLIPFRSVKDEKTGASVKQALLWSCSTAPDGKKDYYIGLLIGKLPLPEAEAAEVPTVEEPTVEEPTVEVPEELLAEEEVYEEVF